MLPGEARNHRGSRQEEQPAGLDLDRCAHSPKAASQRAFSATRVLNLMAESNKPLKSWRWLTDQWLLTIRLYGLLQKEHFLKRKISSEKPQNWPTSDKQWGINTTAAHNQDPQPLKTIQKFPRVGGVFICVRAGFAQSAKLIAGEKQQLYLFMHRYTRDQPGSPDAAMADTLSRREWCMLSVCSDGCRVPGKVVGSSAAWVHQLCSVEPLQWRLAGSLSKPLTYLS